MARSILSPLTPGEKHGRLTLLRRVRYPKDPSHPAWECRCDCGTEKLIAERSIRKGVTQSCGCRLREISRGINLSHGMSGSHEHKIWTGIRKRCLKASTRNFFRYGGRGITICERWSRFENFFADMGPRPSLSHSIERVDNDGPYSPENCVWATAKEQARNTRNVRTLVIDGVSRTVPQWSDMTGIPTKVINGRVRLGWSPRDAVFIPVRGSNYSEWRKEHRGGLRWKDGRRPKD